MKKLLLLMSVLLTASLLWAAEYKFSLSGGAISNSTDPLCYEMNSTFESSGYKAGIRTEGFQSIDISFEKEFRINRTLRTYAGAYYNHIGKEGGMALISTSLGQEITTSSPFFMSYDIGVQSGISYSMYSSRIPFSLSPYLSLYLGLDFDVFKITGYMDWNHFFEKEWQAVPLFGLEMEIHIKNNFSLIMDSYLKAQDYMPNNATALITDLYVGLGLKYVKEV